VHLSLYIHLAASPANHVACPPQDRVVRYGIRLRDDGAVAWWNHVHGVFYSDMLFHSFPFDK
jgi:hypothetical protein